MIEGEGGDGWVPPVRAPVLPAALRGAARALGSRVLGRSSGPPLSGPVFWLRTNGVDTNGAAAKVMDFDRLGKKVYLSTFVKTKVR